MILINEIKISGSIIYLLVRNGLDHKNVFALIYPVGNQEQMKIPPMSSPVLTEWKQVRGQISRT